MIVLCQLEAGEKKSPMKLELSTASESNGIC